MSLVNKNIKKSKTISSEFYYSKQKFEELKESLFAQNWQFICDTTNLSQHGNSVPYEFIKGYIDEPLLAINNNGVIKSLSNVCTHRGNILVENPSN